MRYRIFRASYYWRMWGAEKRELDGRIYRNPGFLRAHTQSSPPLNFRVHDVSFFHARTNSPGERQSRNAGTLYREKCVSRLNNFILVCRLQNSNTKQMSININRRIGMNQLLHYLSFLDIDYIKCICESDYTFNIPLHVFSIEKYKMLTSINSVLSI